MYKQYKQKVNTYSEFNNSLHVSTGIAILPHSLCVSGTFRGEAFERCNKYKQQQNMEEFPTNAPEREFLKLICFYFY